MQQKIPQNCGIFVIYQKFQLKLDIFVVVDFHVFFAVDAHVFGVAEGDIVGAFRRGSVVDGLVVMFLIDAEIGLFGLFFKLLTTVPSRAKIVRYTASFTLFSRIAAKNFNFFQNRACIFAQALIY